MLLFTIIFLITLSSLYFHLSIASFPSLYLTFTWFFFSFIFSLSVEPPVPSLSLPFISRLLSRRPCSHLPYRRLGPVMPSRAPLRAWGALYESPALDRKMEMSEGRSARCESLQQRENDQRKEYMKRKKITALVVIVRLAAWSWHRSIFSTIISHHKDWKDRKERIERKHE